MEKMLETMEYRGFVIAVVAASYQENPLEHSLGSLYDEHGRNGAKKLHENFDIDDVFDSYGSIKNEFKKKHHVIPVYITEHGSVSIKEYRSDIWDSSFVGIYVCEREQGKKEGMTEEEILARMRYELELYEHYLNGYIYEYQIYEKWSDGSLRCVDFYDMLYPGIQFYGYDFSVLFEHAKEDVDHIIENEEIEIPSEWKQSGFHLEISSVSLIERLKSKYKHGELNEKIKELAELLK